MAVAILERILATGNVTDDRGNQFPLHSGISSDEGDRISACIQRRGISRTLEVGCAFGISSLYICRAISQQSDPCHIIIDPMQSTQWQHVGVTNLRRAGFRFWQLIEEPSEIALPSLVKDGVTVQFALIDGWHTFDHVLIDFFYIDRLLEDGGIVAFDDLGMAGVNKAVRYILNYPNYSLVEPASEPDTPESIKRRAFGFMLRQLSHVLPAHMREHYFNASWLKPGHDIGLTGSFAFLQKSGPDKRNWDWYKPF